MKISTDAFRSNETGKLFKGDQQLNNGLREMLFPRPVCPVGVGEAGKRPYGRGAVCLFWDLTAAEVCECVCELMCVCVCVCVCVWW